MPLRKFSDEEFDDFVRGKFENAPMPAYDPSAWSKLHVKKAKSNWVPRTLFVSGVVLLLLISGAYVATQFGPDNTSTETESIPITSQKQEGLQNDNSTEQINTANINTENEATVAQSDKKESATQIKTESSQQNNTQTAGVASVNSASSNVKETTKVQETSGKPKRVQPIAASTELDETTSDDSPLEEDEPVILVETLSLQGQNEVAETNTNSEEAHVSEEPRENVEENITLTVAETYIEESTESSEQTAGDESSATLIVAEDEESSIDDESTIVIEEIAEKTTAATTTKEIEQPIITNTEETTQEEATDEESDDPVVKPEKKRFSRFAVGGLLNADLTTVKMKDFTGPGTGIGLRATFNITPRLAISSGISRVKKVYIVTDNEDYTAPTTWPAGEFPDQIDAVCTVTEIPLNIRYDLVQFQRGRLYGLGGLNSFLMNKEVYDLDFGTYNGSREWEVKGENKHYLSVMNLSLGYEKYINEHWSWALEMYYQSTVAGVGAYEISLNSIGNQFLVNYRF